MAGLESEMLNSKPQKARDAREPQAKEKKYTAVKPRQLVNIPQDWLRVNTSTPMQNDLPNERMSFNEIYDITDRITHSEMSEEFKRALIEAILSNRGRYDSHRDAYRYLMNNIEILPQGYTTAGLLERIRLILAGGDAAEAQKFVDELREARRKAVANLAKGLLLKRQAIQYQLNDNTGNIAERNNLTSELQRVASQLRQLEASEEVKKVDTSISLQERVPEIFRVKEKDKVSEQVFPAMATERIIATMNQQTAAFEGAVSALNGFEAFYMAKQDDLWRVYAVCCAVKQPERKVELSA
jgi:nitrogen fixation protein FixH